MTLSFTIFFGQKNLNRAHMLFQVLCGFEPVFYTTHPNEEPEKYVGSVRAVISRKICNCLFYYFWTSCPKVEGGCEIWSL